MSVDLIRVLLFAAIFGDPNQSHRDWDGKTITVPSVAGQELNSAPILPFCASQDERADCLTKNPGSEGSYIIGWGRRSRSSRDRHPPYLDRVVLKDGLVVAATSRERAPERELTAKLARLQNALGKPNRVTGDEGVSARQRELEADELNS